MASATAPASAPVSTRAPAPASAPASASVYPPRPFGRTISNPAILKLGPEYLAFNEQVLRFLFLADTLSRSGMCAADIHVCMQRYVSSMPKACNAGLEIHFSHLDEVLLNVTPHHRNVKSSTPAWAPTLAGFASLGKGLTKSLVLDALRAARLRFIEYPSWVLGAGSWFFTLARRRSDKPVFGENGKLVEVIDRFHLPRWEEAAWLVFMARLRLLVPTPEMDEFLTSRRKAYREAWWSFFGLANCESHFNQHCKCSDRTWAFPNEAYVKTKPGFEASNLAAASLEEPLRRLLGFGPQGIARLNVAPLQPAVIAFHWPQDGQWLDYDDNTTSGSEWSDAFIKATIEALKKDHPDYDHTKFSPLPKTSTSSKPRANKAKGAKGAKGKGRSSSTPAVPAPKNPSSIVIPVTRLAVGKPLKPSAPQAKKIKKTEA